MLVALWQIHGAQYCFLAIDACAIVIGAICSTQPTHICTRPLTFRSYIARLFHIFYVVLVFKYFTVYFSRSMAFLIIDKIVESFQWIACGCFSTILIMIMIFPHMIISIEWQFIGHHAWLKMALDSSEITWRISNKSKAIRRRKICRAFNLYDLYKLWFYRNDYRRKLFHSAQCSK